MFLYFAWIFFVFFLLIVDNEKRMTWWLGLYSWLWFWLILILLILVTKILMAFLACVVYFSCAFPYNIICLLYADNYASIWCLGKYCFFFFFFDYNNKNGTPQSSSVSIPKLLQLIFRLLTRKIFMYHTLQRCCVNLFYTLFSAPLLLTAFSTQWLN